MPFNMFLYVTLHVSLHVSFYISLYIFRHSSLHEAGTRMCMHGAAPDMLEGRDAHGARASHYAADKGCAHVLEFLYSEVRAGASVMRSLVFVSACA